MTRVELRKINHSFRARRQTDTERLIRDLDLTVDSGQYVVILGPSGCGKTTLLRAIAGLIRPDAGEILLDGNPVQQLPPRQRDVAMVFQHDALYPHLRIAQSLSFAAGDRAKGRELSQRIELAVQLARIAPILDRHPAGLSGGELRRAAIAKAIVRGASVRLLDEPLSALDAPLRYALQQDLRRWHQQVPGTTLHVTHDGQEAMRMADRIAVMHAGRIVQFDSPSEIYRRPLHLAVATAIGAPPMNTWNLPPTDGRSPADGTLPQIHIPNVPRPNAAGGAGSAGWIVGVRPQQLTPLPHDDGASTPPPGLTLTATIVQASVIDERVHLAVAAGDENHAVVVSPGDWPLGKTLRLHAEPAALHWFDADSGQRWEPTADG